MSITKHEEGSLRELWTIAFPLMISALSVMLMLFVDRLLLAHYSTAALNAAVNSTTLGWSFVYGWLVLASIAEVFVAQYNGAEQKHKLGEPVWQMIWLSLLSFSCFLPLALWGGGWFFGLAEEQQAERQYFSWMMIFGPSYPLYGALCGFFIGQGKTRLITWLAVIANFINAGLDVILIFGLEGWIEPMGVRGAAIATSGSTVFQVIILGAIFLNKNNRQHFGTKDYQLKWQPLWQCLRVGSPSALFVALEVLGWALYYSMMTKASEKHITVASICQSIVILFYFFSEGVNKATTTIAGNLIGAKKNAIISQVIWSGLKMHALFLCALLALFFGFSEHVIDLFLPTADPEMIAEISDALVTGILCICLYLFFEGVRMLMAGVLTAAGDTLFLLIAGSLSAWLLLVAPIYLVIIHGQGRVEYASLICLSYGVFSALLYGWRFFEGKWKKISLITG